MSFFNKLKSNILGSVKEDLNSALGGKQQLFNSKISGAVDDLIAMKTGIQISNIPSNITEASTQAAEARKLYAAKRTIDSGMDSRSHISTSPNDSMLPPENRTHLQFPTVGSGDHSNRYVDNWIIFSTNSRRIDAQHILGIEEGWTEATGADYARDTMVKAGFHKFEGETLGDSAKSTMKANGGHMWNEQVDIALFFPNNVKDTISIDYETKEVGIGDTIINAIMGKGWHNELGNFEGVGTGSGAAVMSGLKEAWKNAENSMMSFRPIQEGNVANNPKFNLFNGVGLREHTYTFNLNPYNEADSQEITKIVKNFKMLSLPTSSAYNPRLKILPAEFAINFQGPILGHIEHPQNCYLSSVDVDYSGGKDMSFISVETYTPEVKEDKEAGTKGTKADGNVQHYPNGITLTLVFKEVLQLNRQRYNARVAANAMGVMDKDTMRSIVDDMALNSESQRNFDEQATEDDNPPVDYEYSPVDGTKTHQFATKDEAIAFREGKPRYARSYYSKAYKHAEGYWYIRFDPGSD